MDLQKLTTRELRQLLDTCHRLHEFDSWFDLLAREYRQRADRKPFHPEQDAYRLGIRGTGAKMNHPNSSSKKNALNLSHRSYRSACDRAFRENISNPTVYWNSDDGFYVAPSRDLVPNSDLVIGLAYYCLTNNGARSLSATRREYQPIASGIRAFYRQGERGSLWQFVTDAQHEADYRDYQDGY